WLVGVRQKLRRRLDRRILADVGHSGLHRQLYSHFSSVRRRDAEHSLQTGFEDNRRLRIHRHVAPGGLGLALLGKGDPPGRALVDASRRTSQPGQAGLFGRGAVLRGERHSVLDRRTPPDGYRAERGELELPAEQRIKVSNGGVQLLSLPFRHPAVAQALAELA